jgi:ABC-type multidrug transport system ATPase subunit
VVPFPLVSALFEAEELRVDEAGIPVVDGLTCASSSDTVLVLGAPRALFGALSGVRTPSHGRLAVLGVPPIEAVRGGKLGSAPYDATLPGSWTLGAYVTWAARLSRGGVDARSRAEDAIERLLLRPFAASRCRTLAPHVVRAGVIAGALAAGAEALFFEDPTLGLPDAVARPLARTVMRALEGKKWALFCSTIALDSPFALRADEAMVFANGAFAVQGAPAEIAVKDRTFFVRAFGPTDALATRIRAAGGDVRGEGDERVIELGPRLTSTDLFELAAEADVTIVELAPVARGF